MARQHSAPILLPADGSPARALAPLGDAGRVSEREIQALVHAFPDLLPIQEIDPAFVGAVAICRELSTPAGPIDNLLVTPSGLPVIVECKLWRNPEGRREVVGQVLDYAKELSRWTSVDLHREVSRRLREEGGTLLGQVRAASYDVDEGEFNDALTLNLRRGRVLLLIVGDGIHEGVEAIAQYLQTHAGLHFSLGLVELALFVLPDGRKLACPRVLARTEVLTRHVIALPDGPVVSMQTDGGASAQLQGSSTPDDEPRRFWGEFLDGLRLDDPEQGILKPSRQGYLSFMLPAPQASCWLTVYRDANRNELGVTLSYAQGYPGEAAVSAILENWDELRDELGGEAALIPIRGRDRVNAARRFGTLDDPGTRAEAFAWLRDQVNRFVNVLRPRVRSVVKRLASRQPD